MRDAAREIHCARSDSEQRGFPRPLNRALLLCARVFLSGWSGYVKGGMPRRGVVGSAPAWAALPSGGAGRIYASEEDLPAHQIAPDIASEMYIEQLSGRVLLACMAMTGGCG